LPIFIDYRIYNLSSSSTQPAHINRADIDQQNLEGETSERSTSNGAPMTNSERLRARRAAVFQHQSVYDLHSLNAFQYS